MNDLFEVVAQEPYRRLKNQERQEAAGGGLGLEVVI